MGFNFLFVNDHLNICIYFTFLLYQIYLFHCSFLIVRVSISHFILYFLYLKGI